jgi:hypothetical protein
MEWKRVNWTNQVMLQDARLPDNISSWRPSTIRRAFLHLGSWVGGAALALYIIPLALPGVGGPLPCCAPIMVVAAGRRLVATRELPLSWFGSAMGMKRDNSRRT